MEILSGIVGFILHIDTHLGQIINDYGTLSYLILFAIIFAETGFVFTPFLPGDSLLFAAGAFAALGSFNILLVLGVLWLAAFLGDTVNYWIGHFFGQALIDNPKIPLKKEHIEKTQKFYDKYGGKTIFLARFVPVGKMHYGNFIKYNLMGGLVWVSGFTLLGYFFGNIEFVKKNFSLVVLVIILLSVVPIIYEFTKAKLSKNKK